MDIKELIKKAEAGDAKAQFDLGECYYYGKGVKQDCAKAFKYFKLAAEQGHAEAKKWNQNV